MCVCVHVYRCVYPHMQGYPDMYMLLTWCLSWWIGKLLVLIFKYPLPLKQSMSWNQKKDYYKHHAVIMRLAYLILTIPGYTGGVWFLVYELFSSNVVHHQYAIIIHYSKLCTAEDKVQHKINTSGSQYKNHFGTRKCSVYFNIVI